MLNISPAAPDERTAALSLLFGLLSRDDAADRADEVLAAADRGEISLSGLLIARDGPRMAGVVMFIMQQDGTAFVWPARARTKRGQQPVIDALYAEIARHVDEGEIVSAQAIVELDAAADREALNRNGFEHLADLFYLQRLLGMPLPRRVKVSFEITTFAASQNEERFARLVEQTYIDTLDCPRFHAHRSGREALASHRCSGDVLPEQWKIFTLDGRDVGLMMMNDHPAQQAWELVYMGVTPEARGRGYGRAMLLDGLHAARREGRDSVLLAVDADNEPANRIYDELGFLEIASRAVHVRGGGSR